MDCRAFDKALGDYISKELPLPARLACDEHVVQCEACRSGLYAFRKTIALASRAYDDRGRTAGALLEEAVAAVLSRLRSDRWRIEINRQFMYFG